MKDEKKNLKLMESCGNYNKWIADTLKPFVKGSVVELGCGTGTVARYFFNDRYYGIDIDEGHIKECQKLFVSPKNFHCFDAVGGVPAFFRGKFDTVLMVNFLEHVYADTAVIENAWRMLKKGGKIVILVPAGKWNYGSIDVADGHYRRYNKAELKELLKKRFNVLTVKNFNLFGSFGWYMTGKVFPSTTHKSSELGLFDEMVPLFKRFENKVDIPFGLSIFVVGEKK